MNITRYLHVCMLAIGLLQIPHSLARPLENHRMEKRGTDVNQFPNGVPTKQPDKNDECWTTKPEFYANGTKAVWVSDCCDGFTGDNCDVKVETTEQGSGDAENKTDFEDPCKNLQCVGVKGATCLTVSKCGERWPVFLADDGTLASCANGQPENPLGLTCTGGCVNDPCAGQTCREFPDAFCVHTACDCSQQMWLTETGVQVDCETGEYLSPEEARARRRRRKREAEDLPSTSSCS